MGTKAKPDKFDCYTKAADDEPIFVLCGLDTLAPDVVRYWAESYSKSLGPDLTERQREKHASALACADAMEEWR